MSHNTIFRRFAPTRTRSFLFALALPVLAACPANATVMSVDLVSSGDNLLTRDTAQGLDFLDLTESAGLSFNFVTTQFGTTGKFAGFQHATIAQVATLINNYGLFASTIPQTPDAFVLDDELSGLVADLGVTSAGQGYREVIGITATGGSPGTHHFAQLYDADASGGDYVFTADEWDDASVHGCIGHFLVRKSTSVHSGGSTIMMLSFAAGLLGLVSRIGRR